MKNYFKIAGILAAIACVCAAILAGINLLTSQVIAANDEKTQKNTITTICDTRNLEFDDFTTNTDSYEVTADGAKYTATVKATYDVLKGGKSVCKVYTVTGKNDYGTITLMVEIEKTASNDYVVGDVEFIENGQSFGSTVNAFLKGAYISSKDDSVYEGGCTTDVEAGANTLGESDIKTIDVKCGATYGASLVRDLTLAALKAAKEGK